VTHWTVVGNILLKNTDRTLCSQSKHKTSALRPFSRFT